MERGARKKRLWMGYSILAALLLLGYNGSKLMTLLTPSLPGLSGEVRKAQQKWDRIRDADSLLLKGGDEEIDLDRILAGFTRTYPDKTAPVASCREEKKEVPSVPRLPNLAGILLAENIKGRKLWRAVIEGKALSEGDQVKGFTVRKITARGVILAREGKSWFIPAPKVRFSLDQGL